MKNPSNSRLIQPGEWMPHTACWTAWPSAAHLWEDNLVPAQAEFSALCRALFQFGEKLHVLVPNKTEELVAAKALQGLGVQFHVIPFGDIWLRDTGPIFLKDGTGATVASSFAFNGWGEKYVLPHDAEVSLSVAGASDLPAVRREWILEGGSIESDGEGTVLTSKQCLLNPNRNPRFDLAAVEERLRQDLGADKVLWVGDGLINDHTDGHIDTIARYIGPAEVVCMAPADADDPNKEILEKIYTDLCAMTDAKGRKLTVHRIPGPGTVKDEEDSLMPASYLNFYIANKGVVVPVYGSPNDSKAVRALEKIFPDRKVVGLSAKAILSGGGAFHCITQHQPA